MATKIIDADIDLNDNILKNVKLDVVISDPSTPSDGRVWLNSTIKKLKYAGNSLIRTLSFDFLIRLISASTEAVENDHIYVTTATQTITLPGLPIPSQTIIVSVGNFTDTIIARNGNNIMSLAEDLTIDSGNVTVILRYIDATRGWILV